MFAVYLLNQSTIWVPLQFVVFLLLTLNKLKKKVSWNKKKIFPRLESNLQSPFLKLWVLSTAPMTHIEFFFEFITIRVTVWYCENTRILKRSLRFFFPNDVPVVWILLRVNHKKIIFLGIYLPFQNVWIVFFIFFPFHVCAVFILRCFIYIGRGDIKRYFKNLEKPLRCLLIFMLYVIKG